MTRNLVGSQSAVAAHPILLRHIARWIGGVVLLLAVTGCTGPGIVMQDVPADRANYVPGSGNALVIFMRPSGYGSMFQSPVFDITSGEPEFLGIVSAKTKIAHSATPGDHRYMVIGESAGFLEANLLAERTYYSLVTPRIGAWSPRFSLKPMHKADLASAKFAEWYDVTRWIENTPASRTWARENMASIKSKQDKYLPNWLARTDKRALLPNDGK